MRHESPPQIRSMTGDSHVRHGERVFDPPTIRAHVEGDEVLVSFKNHVRTHPEQDVPNTVVSGTIADALREMADIIERAGRND